MPELTTSAIAQELHRALLITLDPLIGCELCCCTRFCPVPAADPVNAEESASLDIDVLRPVRFIRV